MADNDPRDVFLEVAPASQGPVTRESPAAPAGGAYLEPTAPDDDAPDAPASDASPKRKKARAADRPAAANHADQVSLAIVAALQTDRPLMACLWPDVPAADLLRTPPPDEAFAARCDYARRALDAVARRDAESRARAEVAQRALQSHLAALTQPGASPREAALAELRRAQVAELFDALRVLAGGARSLYAADVARLLTAAETRGIDADAARALAREKGYELHEAEARTWTPLDALPGAPTSLDAAAVALLQHPAQGHEAVRGGAVLAWLRANAASPDVVQRARDARTVAERGGAETLSVHTQAWALGRKDLVAGSVWLRAPGEIAPAVRAGKLSLDDLGRSARDNTLGAWLRTQGWVAAAGAADLVARGEPSGMKRLAWSLGEPLLLGDQGVGDPAALARLVLARPDLREAAESLYASGDLLAWLESLPAVLRDEQWADRIRRARADGTRAADLHAFWAGVYAHARASTLTVYDTTGAPVVLTSPAQLRVTAQAAEVWDSLKRALRSGELLAWLTVVAPEADLPALPRPPRDEDGELNALLWSLGHAGLVMEWGPHDTAVNSPGDLVRAYQRSWQQFESQIARGYVLDWLERFHGASTLLPAAPSVAAVRVRDVTATMRAEVGRLPAGYLALKLALVCGMRDLPLDPCAPGDQATFRGYSGVTRRPPGSARAWQPLRDHAQHGTAVLWLALDADVRPQLARSMLQSAFSSDGDAMGADHAQKVVAALARTFGDPVPSQALEAELGAVATQGARASIASAAPAFVPPPRPSGSWVRGLVLTACLAVGLAGAWALYAHRESLDPAQPPAAPGAEVWVQLRVRAEADRTNQGNAWDLDRSPPDLRVTLHPRDETVVVGPREDSRVCEGSINAVRLVPDVPFRVAVDEMDYTLPDRVGAVWVAWHGGREETLRVRVGAVDVTVTVRRLSFQPAPAAVTPVAPSASTAVDAGARNARTTPARAVDAGARRAPRRPRPATVDPARDPWADPQLQQPPPPPPVVIDPF